MTTPKQTRLKANPDENLEEQKRLARAILGRIDKEGVAPSPVVAAGLAESVLSLDAWLRKGGCLPKSWRRTAAVAEKTAKDALFVAALSELRYLQRLQASLSPGDLLADNADRARTNALVTAMKQFVKEVL